MAARSEDRVSDSEDVPGATVVAGESESTEGEGASAKQAKVVALRKKLSMAKEMLEELLQERDELNCLSGL